jgi:hypothetical protein
MPRSTSNVIWTVVLVVLVLLGLAAAVLGPRLYREGRAFVAPIAELAASESAMAALDEEFPFEPPEDGLVRESRLLVFFDIEDELRAQYEPWQALVNELEGRRAQSWQEAKEALAATRDVHRAQREILRSHGMSRAELVWLEDTALPWWRQIEPQLSHVDRPTVAEGLREAAREDLRFVAELEHRHGSSPALRAMEHRLRDRLASLESSVMPETTGLSAENQELLWRHRERVAAIGDLSAHPLHGILREGEGIVVTVGEDGQPVLGPPPERVEQD